MISQLSEQCDSKFCFQAAEMNQNRDYQKNGVKLRIGKIWLDIALVVFQLLATSVVFLASANRISLNLVERIRNEI